MFQHLAATLMHFADGGADFSITVRRDVFGEEINQSPIALQQGQHLHGPVRCLDGRLDRFFNRWRWNGGWRWRGWLDLSRSQAEFTRNLVRDLTARKQREETFESVSEPFSKAHDS